MSDIVFDCPECGHNLIVDAAGAGRVVNCPECSRPIRIPEADVVVDSQASQRAVTEAAPTATGETLVSVPERARAVNSVADDSLLPAQTQSNALPVENILFVWTRRLTLLISVAVIVGIVIGCFHFYRVANRSLTQVTFSEIDRLLNPGAPSKAKGPGYSKLSPGREGILAEALPDIEMPENVKKYITGGRIPVFLTWMKDRDPAQRKDFIANLSIVLAAAEREKIDVQRVIDEYARLKQMKLREDVFDRYAGQITKVTLLTLVAFLAGLLLVLFSLILVLSGIEKNLRASNSLYPSNSR